MPEPAAKIDFLAVVACDDVRREANGKFILIGMYSDGVVVHELPTTVSLSFGMVFRIHSPGVLRLEFKIEGPSKGASMKLGAALRIEDNLEVPEKQSFIYLPQMGFRILEPGEIALSYRVDGGDWIEIRKVRVSYKSLEATSSPSAP